MGEVKQSDIDLVVNALTNFFHQSIQRQNFNLDEFLNVMESTFQEAGYREPQGGGDEKTNILIMHDDGVGDFIMTSSAIREIRRIYPDAYITLMVFPRSHSMAECCPYVDELLLCLPSNDDWANILSSYLWAVDFAKILLRRRFDICYCFSHYGYSALLMYMSGAKIRISRNFYIKGKGDMDNPVYDIYHLLSTDSVPRQDINGVDHFLALIEHVLHARVTNRDLEAWYTPFDKTVAKMALLNVKRPIYALCMGSTSPKRKYSPEKYAKLIEMILDEDSMVTIVILGGGEADLRYFEIFINALDERFYNRVLNFTNRLTYRQSAAVLSMCEMYIGNNTGTMHIAAAVKCPVLQPNCCPADLPDQSLRDTQSTSPYRVPSVLVQPKHALPECAVNEPYHSYGCRAEIPHCITQIAPETIFKGFHLLKERIAQNKIEPLYIC